MKCPNCDFEEHLENVDYCQECGVCIINFCTNNNCEQNNDDNIQELPANAKFCPYCSSESSFKEAGFFDKE